MNPTPDPPPALTAGQVAAELDVSAATVCVWCSTGQLRAVNVSRKVGGRASWRIERRELDRFKESRTTSPPPPKQPRRRKPADVIEFY
ncbi:helix-turn-helix domain-containing protein [Saccharicrinis sp. FJH54]|uniref:helix-turn-helix domain-containing protein n=1 Tax=Saccharicrinis sp. FJH54 TaxID=3344665 RepID=UPI0035D41BE4